MSPPLCPPHNCVTFRSQDGDDDVRAVAAEALLPVASHLAVADAAAVAQLRAMLWDILLDVEELSPSTGVQSALTTCGLIAPTRLPLRPSQLPTKRSVSFATTWLTWQHTAGIPPGSSQSWAFLQSFPAMYPLLHKSTLRSGT